jgi:hypothetical protein
MMTRLALAFTFVAGFNSIAKADLVYLACTEATVIQSSRTMSITIDTAQHTATVDNDPAAPFIDQENAVILFRTIRATSPATLNRVTGRFKIGEIEGTCTPAKRLF